ncbi:hypothetical protein W822_20025 [Advenella kashmirensis W13003]|uniref:Phage gp6-like head-tail connector protein n=1 Tax=Advenella kashmirensis W13003 TaxID=1424334 RepID=V8QNM4_9BURK|nr:phage head-tail connector protein [Advenella kashmirensis]ETF00938.1 hypothetical protein W822_20025 [Advenella kashmirensis W13003]
MATDIATIKFMLRIDDSSALDDEQLGVLIAAAEAEALQFIDADQLPDESEIVPAIALLVECAHDTLTPDEFRIRRERAESILFPYREKLGI